MNELAAGPAPNVVHFAIHADDVERARSFYEGVFGWSFEAWGPPDFYLIRTGPDEAPGIQGALQKRQIPLAEGQGFTGFECTVSVADVEAVGAAVREHGGSVETEPIEIPTVGTLIQFRDTEGNLACAMRYEEGRV